MYKYNNALANIDLFAEGLLGQGSDKWYILKYVSIASEGVVKVAVEDTDLQAKEYERVLAESNLIYEKWFKIWKESLENEA